MNLVARLRQDELLDRVVRNSAHLFSSNTTGLALSVLQSILAARMLGPEGFGVVGIVMSYASTINGLLSFRMGEVVVRYGGEYLEKGDKAKAAALIKVSSRVELAVSTLAFLVVIATAGLAARYAAKTPGTTLMFVIYGFGLLCNFNSETATGILQITNRIKTRGTINLIQALCTAAVIVGAFILNSSMGLNRDAAMLVVLAGYLLGKAVLGLGLFVTGRSEMRRVLGHEWQRVKVAQLPSMRHLLNFAVSSNLSATAILLFRESEVLWIGLLLNSEAAGLFKVAYTIVILLSVPADPLIMSVHPELNRLVVQEAWGKLRQFLTRITAASFSYNAAIAVGLVVLGRRVLSIFGEQYEAAYPAMLVLLLGLVFNYTLFWNRPLLLSLSLQRFALGAIALVGAVKLLLSFLLVPRYGYVMEALLLSGYFVASVGAMVWRGVREVNGRADIALRQQSAADR